MKKILLLIVLPSMIFCCPAWSQMKYGYAVLHLRCGNDDSRRNRVYFSPIIELDRLNFEKYTDGMDPSFAKYSVRYYNYAITRWFEIYLQEKHKVYINDPAKYLRYDTCVVFNNTNNGTCTSNLTNAGCFFTSKQQLKMLRDHAITDSKKPEHQSEICEVVVL